MFKIPLIAFLLFYILSCTAQDKPLVDLQKQQWIHGSAECATDTNVSIQVVQYNPSTWILRQNKCLNYEAPFLFLFLGEEKALLMDTGATADPFTFPLQKTVGRIIAQWETTLKKKTPLVVAHTHGHGDHHAADAQFKEVPNTTVVGLSAQEVQQYFNIKNWPKEEVNINLGNRILDILPIPGHQSASIAVYDRDSQLLLTGDTFYPGRLYVEDWFAFKKSIKRLVDFSNTHKIHYILGNHIEMTRTLGKDYPIGTTYQPNEQPLPLFKEDLYELHQALEHLGDVPTRKVHDKFIIYPTK
ncbi:MBL fold metallo-hydrolase [Spongiimicrobium salis]|uniref:MBL fold metallo-hydrolase n=1 Tax=Spongiimicrobium salis TaxID=1667022 RepID=UPI00374D4F65